MGANEKQAGQPGLKSPIDGSATLSATLKRRSPLLKQGARTRPSRENDRDDRNWETVVLTQTLKPNSLLVPHGSTKLSRRAVEVVP